MILTLICALATLANGASFVVQAAPQEGSPKRDVMVQESTVVVTTQDGGQPAKVMVGPRAEGDTFVFVSGEMSFDGKVVKGAPYSAQAVTETIQVLGDGNRIVRRATALVYRDSEGRTRREQTLHAIGPYASANEPPQMIFINDPVAGVNYIFDANKKTARKIEVMAAGGRDGAKAEGDAAAAVSKMRMIEQHHSAGVLRKRRASEADPALAIPMPPPGVGIAMGHSPERIKFREPKVESLGRQTVEGVEAEGKRSTITIAAGEIGNEQPINIIDESWYSPELQTTVMSRHSDPRFGETTYRLTNINRSEPARTLFELPSDYTVEEVIPGNMKFKLERELQRAREKKEKEL
jgi:hypothetical protein